MMGTQDACNYRHMNCSMMHARYDIDADGPVNWNNRAHVLAAVRLNGCWLRHAAAHLKNDTEIVSVAVGNAACAITQASGARQDTYGIAFKAVTTHGYAIKFISPRLRDNYQIALAAISQDHTYMWWMSDKFKMDLDVLMAMMLQYFISLAYIAPALRDNPDLVMVAVSYRSTEFCYASTRVQVNPAVLALATSKCEHTRSAFRLARRRPGVTGIAALKMAQSGWAPCRHFMYWGDRRAAIHTTLLAAHRLECKSPSGLRLPAEMWLLLLGFI
jgi:hypothetical protein